MKKAVIFDMDGVISDTQKYHTRAEMKILRRFGIYMKSKEIVERYSGVSDEYMFADIFDRHKITVDVSIAVSEKWKLMEKILPKKIEAIPYVRDLIISLKEKGFKLAVASASPLKFIFYVLKALQMNEYFDVLVSSEEVRCGKPNPDIFLIAAERLQVNPQDIVVIEDGISGMIGAKRAGMPCIGLVEKMNTKYPAPILITNLNQLTIRDIMLL